MTDVGPWISPREFGNGLFALFFLMAFVLMTIAIIIAPSIHFTFVIMDCIFIVMAIIFIKVVIEEGK